MENVKTENCACRNASIARANTVVVKVGSAVLTDETGLSAEVIGSLASQIAYIRHAQRGSGQGRKIVLVSSGSVAAGRALLRARGMDGKPNQPWARHALAAIGQSRLMDAWNMAFEPYGALTAQVLLTRDDLRSRTRFQVAAGTFSGLLEWDILPIVNENDTVTVSDLRFGDNDCLASLLVNLVEADLFVNLTSAPGVYASDPAQDPNATLMDCIPCIAQLDIDSLCGQKTAVGSGGMHSKLLAARRVAQLGVPTLILPGRVPDILKNAFAGDSSAGTWICGDEKSIPRRKFWLAYQSEPAGALVVDEGAMRALLYDGRSLLPGGVTEVQGEFADGALVRVSHAGQNIGVGFCNYDSATLRSICGRKRHEIAAVLGQARYPDAIHRDNLLLDAAI